MPIAVAFNHSYPITSFKDDDLKRAMGKRTKAARDVLAKHGWRWDVYTDRWEDHVIWLPRTVDQNARDLTHNRLWNGPK